MARKNKILLFLSLALLLFCGCKSSKRAVSAIAKSDVELVNRLAAEGGGIEGISAKVKLSANIDGKAVSSPGNLKVKKNCGVQLSITPLGLFEAARVEFLPAYVQYINKFDAEYSQIDYNGLSLLKELGIGYALLESVFLNKIYMPSDINEFLSNISVERDRGLLVITNKAQGITYKYYIDEAKGLLIKSIGAYNGGAAVSCEYGSFQQLGEYHFPTTMKLSLEGVNKAINITFSLSKVRENNEFKPTTPSASYKKVSPASLLKAFGGK